MQILRKKRPIIVAVSGGFDPLHIGHVRLFQEAKKLGNRLVVILNNDNWLAAKKGYVFMPENERKEILEALACVDRVLITSHPQNPKDMSVCNELLKLRPDVFANGGDRHKDNIPEAAICRSIGCQMVFNVGKDGKIQSSSWLVNNCKMTKINIKQLHSIVRKPWGEFRDFAESKGKWHLKTLAIAKGHRLSLQKHAKRSEFWIVAEGKIKIQKDEESRVLTPRKTVFIKKQEIHRIEALTDAVVIEVSFGKYEEDDIKRIADDYDRS